MKRDKLPYANPDRLADVMAMIQVLALHKHRHRSDKGLRGEMQGPPRSASTWIDVAQQHPEFFRVDDQVRLGVSLVATHVLPKNEEDMRELPAGFVAVLLKTAIELHDRQLDRAHHWRVYIPILVAVTTVFGTVFGVFLKWCLEGN